MLRPGRRQVSAKAAAPRRAIETSSKAALRPSAESYFNIGLANYYLKRTKNPRTLIVELSLDPYNAADAWYSLGLTYREWSSLMKRSGVQAGH